MPQLLLFVEKTKTIMSPPIVPCFFPSQNIFTTTAHQFHSTVTWTKIIMLLLQVSYIILYKICTYNLKHTEEILIKNIAEYTNRDINMQLAMTTYHCLRSGIHITYFNNLTWSNTVRTIPDLPIWIVYSLQITKNLRWILRTWRSNFHCPWCYNWKRTASNEAW